MSGEQRFEKTFSRRKKVSNVGQKREKGKEKRVEVVEDRVQAEEEHANVDSVPSSSAESQGGGVGQSVGEAARKPIANGGGGGSSSVSRSATKKRKSDGVGNAGRKQQPKQKRQNEGKQSQQGKQKKLKKEESETKPKPKPKQEGKKQAGKGEKAEQKKKKRKEEEVVEEEEQASAGCRFPLSRVDRIIRNEGSDYRITNEAVFLINKASEKFLEMFCGDSYECAAHDHKKYVSYNHLATAVNREKRFDFLSDYVPEKVRAEKALAERTPPVEK